MPKKRGIPEMELKSDSREWKLISQDGNRQTGMRRKESGSRLTGRNLLEHFVGHEVEEAVRVESRPVNGYGILEKEKKAASCFPI